MPKNISKITTAVLGRTTYIFILFTPLTCLVASQINARFASNDLSLWIANNSFLCSSLFSGCTLTDLFLDLILILEALVQYCKKNPGGLNKNILQE